MDEKVQASNNEVSVYLESLWYSKPTEPVEAKEVELQISQDIPQEVPAELPNFVKNTRENLHTIREIGFRV